LGGTQHFGDDPALGIALQHRVRLRRAAHCPGRHRASVDPVPDRAKTFQAGGIQWEGNIERNRGPVVRARGDHRSASLWSHIIVYELADLPARAVTADLPPGYEVFYTAAPDDANGSRCTTSWAGTSVSAGH
jgi:hypothetical protein